MTKYKMIIMKISPKYTIESQRMTARTRRVCNSSRATLIRLWRRSAALAAYVDEDAMPYAGEGERAIPADAAAGAQRAVGTCKHLGTEQEVSTVLEVGSNHTKMERESGARLKACGELGAVSAG